jgi:hypothetical protein
MFAWPAVAVVCRARHGDERVLARASARGDISIVGPVFALSPIFTVLPDAALSGTWPSRSAGSGLSLSVLGTFDLGRPGTGWRGLGRSSPAATRSMRSRRRPLGLVARWIAGAPAPSAPRAISSLARRHPVLAG